MNVALLFAGGTGVRMGNGPLPKQFLEIEGKAVIVRTILAFEEHPEIDAIVVVCVEDWIDYLKELIDEEDFKKVVDIVGGGPSGQESIYNGVAAIYDFSEDKENTIVLVNDGVRPFVKGDIISRNIECVKEKGTSATSAFVQETIIIVDEDGLVKEIPDRRACMLSKAPQGFRLLDLMNAHQKAIKEGKFDCTNSIELMRYYGYPIYVVEDSHDNIKLTSQIDIHLANHIVKRV